MNRSLNWRWLAAVGAILVLSLADAGAAVATTATGETSELRVSVSLASSGGDPDVATVGDTVTAALSVTNKTWEFREVALQLTLVIPDVRTFDASVKIFLAPFQTLAPKIRYTVNEYFPSGDYSLTLEAGQGNGTASATGMITIHSY
jgi:hypothetical protein